MMRLLDIDLIMTTSVLAKRAGVGRQLINNWSRKNPDFPKPLTLQDGAEAIWYWPDVEAWIENTNRADGKKRTNQHA